MRYINENSFILTQDVPEKNNQVQNNKEQSKRTKPSIMIVETNLGIFCLQTPKRDQLNFVQKLMNTDFLISKFFVIPFLPKYIFMR